MCVCVCVVAIAGLCVHLFISGLTIITVYNPSLGFAEEGDMQVNDREIISHNILLSLLAGYTANNCLIASIRVLCFTCMLTHLCGV